MVFLSWRFELEAVARILVAFCLSIHLSFFPPAHPSAHPFIYPSGGSSVRSSMRLSTLIWVPHKSIALVINSINFWQTKCSKSIALAARLVDHAQAPGRAVGQARVTARGSTWPECPLLLRSHFWIYIFALLFFPFSTFVIGIFCHSAQFFLFYLCVVFRFCPYRTADSADCRLPTTNCRLRTADYGLPTVDCPFYEPPPHACWHCIKWG